MGLQLPAGFIEALRVIQQRLDANNVRWILVGSFCLALQGVAVEPHDIDILTTAEDAYKCQELLKDYLITPVVHGRTSDFASHFGRFQVGTVPVEVMGDLEVREGRKWISLVVRLQNPRRVEIMDILVPLSSLEDQLVGYARSPRKKDRRIANLIRAVLEAGAK